MKILKNYSSTGRYLELQLIKAKNYQWKKNGQLRLTKSNLVNQLIKLKKALQIIYGYNKNRKLIYFVDILAKQGASTPLVFSNKVLKKVIISQASLNSEKLKKPDLVIILNGNTAEIEKWVKLCSKHRIPLINFLYNKGHDKHNQKRDYNFLFNDGGFENRNLTSIKTILINSILKR